MRSNFTLKKILPGNWDKLSSEQLCKSVWCVSGHHTWPILRCDMYLCFNSLFRLRICLEESIYFQRYQKRAHRTRNVKHSWKGGKKIQNCHQYTLEPRWYHLETIISIHISKEWIIDFSVTKFWYWNMTDWAHTSTLISASIPTKWPTLPPKSDP